jgi:hypothetical protein
VYLGTIYEDFLDTPGRRYRWHVFTALTEEEAKRETMATVQPVQPDGPWVDLCDMPEEDWVRGLSERSFPGYVQRKGMERWSGF